MGEKIHAHAIPRFARIGGQRVALAAALEVAEPVPAVACYLHTWCGGGGRGGGGGGGQALMPMHHAYSNPRHGTAVHGS